MPVTATHDLPYPALTDNVLPASVDIKDLAIKVAAELDNIAPSQIAGVPAGRLLIANGSGVVTGAAVSGDGTIDANGVFEIGPKKVGASELADLGVTTGKLDDKAVTASKIADGAVGYYQIGDGQVNWGKIAENAVGAHHILDGQVGTAELANGQVTKAKIAPSSLQGHNVSVSGSAGSQLCTWPTPMASASYFCVATPEIGNSLTNVTLSQKTASNILVSWTNGGSTPFTIGLIALMQS